MSYSFIIPIFNNKVDDISKCITSIINQNIKKYEIIIINDGSTDEELNNYCEFKLKKIKNLKYFYEKNSGSAVARNIGIKNVTCDYIIFVDADDELSSSFFNNIKNLSLNDITIFNYCCVDNDKDILYSLNNKINLPKSKEDIYSNIYFYPGKMNNFMFGSVWGKIFSSRYLKENKILFVPRLRKAQDRVFMLDSFSKTDNINYYPILMYKYKLNNNSITHKMNLKMTEYYDYLYEEMIKFANNNKLQKNITKFLSYNILNELLPLTIFNINYNKKYFIIKSELIKLIKKYKINETLKIIKYKDIPTKKGKVKLFFYNMKLYYLLYKVFYYIQKKENNKLFK